LERTFAPAGRTETTAEDGLRTDEARTLQRIRDLVGQSWVGPFDERNIEQLWESLGDRLTRIAGSNLQLWLRCVDAGAELEDLPQVTMLQAHFVDDVKQRVSGYLALNRQVVLDELRRFGPPAAGSAVPVPAGVAPEQLRDLQRAAASLAKLQ